MQSLRTRRPSDTRAVVKRQASKLEKKPINKNVRKSTVDDKIKKRMSLRYAEISAPTEASVPDVPSVPIGLRPGTARDPDEIVLESASIREDQKAIDQRLLDKEDFDPDSYLKAKLANSTEAELRSLQSSLRSSKDDTAVELQRNVFKNYAEFVLISKEISVLENEVLELKESLSEWKSMPSLLHIDESASAAERRRNVRSSIADLRVLYANQMQTLHTQIEGSTKFAPTTPGRHVVYDMDGIFALNAATYKVNNTVKFVVLDDSVLVAKRRRRNNGEGGRLVAERCWPLNEMLVLDTKDTATMTNVFKIRYQKETYVYRTEAASDKKNLLGQFRQVAEELAIRKRREREGEHERRKSMWTGADRSSMTLHPDAMPSLPDWMAELARKAGVEGDTSARDKTERDARFISDFSDDLTVAIALRSWERAVELVEEGRVKVSSMPLLSAKLTPLTAGLISALLDALSAPGNRKNTAVSLIGYLLKLGQGPAARSTFLYARAEAMNRYVRAIKFEGHVGMYVHDLAVVMFTGIKHTADWFLAGFVEHEMTSTFIDWAKKQIELYAERFRKQVYSSDAEPQTVKEALKISHSQSRKLLQEFGLDFRFLLDELLVQNPQTSDTCVVSATFHAPSFSRSQTPQSTSSFVSSSAPMLSIPSVPISPARSTTRSPMPVRPVIQLHDSDRPPRSSRDSPAPPPRSSNRPGSTNRPPVAIPQREGMF
ncbi:uncharacterized protein EDB91DRAFT_1127738 [Suillus paluster]|uniref:uncharacterized protein n=1 Tax=Suillus paluster TaxID=48578 RepID=UPI001B85BF0B|nr:uncharacterized protein EDB91DRAFT_1127738 [Suillus paluster]KAG1742727.1 hypothetical protein EDB91DRAFT_1127738 [Suillus paluster]